MITIRDTIADDLPAILNIHNHYIAHTTVIFRDETVGLDERIGWFTARKEQGFAVLSAMEGDRLVGYAAYGEFRKGSGYRQTVENSVYVAPGQMQKGIGRALMLELIARARAHGLHMMVAGIGLPNDASIHLHKTLGFVETGRLPEVGIKASQRLGLCLMQLRL